MKKRETDRSRHARRKRRRGKTEKKGKNLSAGTKTFVRRKGKRVASGPHSGIERQGSDSSSARTRKSHMTLREKRRARKKKYQAKEGEDRNESQLDEKKHRELRLSSPRRGFGRGQRGIRGGGETLSISERKGGDTKKEERNAHFSCAV